MPRMCMAHDINNEVEREDKCNGVAFVLICFIMALHNRNK